MTAGVDGHPGAERSDQRRRHPRDVIPCMVTHTSNAMDSLSQCQSRISHQSMRREGTERRVCIADIGVQRALQNLMDDLGIEAADLRAVFDVEQRSIEKWMSGETIPQKETRRRLNEL